MSFLYAGQSFTSVRIARLVVDENFERGTCDWQISYFPEPTTNPETGEVEYYDDPSPLIRECGAEAAFGHSRWECAAGHKHVYAEFREAEGWDYAEDDDEAARMIRAGVRPVDIHTNQTYT